jgi:hypothetical protein
MGWSLKVRSVRCTESLCEDISVERAVLKLFGRSVRV